MHTFVGSHRVHSKTELCMILYKVDGEESTEQQWVLSATAWSLTSTPAVIFWGKQRWELLTEALGQQRL